MRENKLRPENFWGTIHCISSLISMISSKKNIRNSSASKRNNGADSLSTANSQKDNTILFSGMIQNEKLRAFSIEMFSDMYLFNFEKTSSVNEILNLKKDSSYSKLSKINLLEHTFGVINEIRKIVGTKHGLYSDFFILIAMLHDYGKCKELLKHYEISITIPHHNASSDYLRAMIIRNKSLTYYYKDLIGRVIESIDAHHSPEAGNLFYGTKDSADNKEFQLMLLEQLKLADAAQRDKEVEKLNDI